MRFPHVPFLAKLAAVGGVGVLLSIPLSMTQGKISERQELNHQARSAIALSSAGPQRVTLPVIEHLCRETVVVERTVHINERDQIVRDTKEREVVCGRIVPDTLQVDGAIDAEAEPRRKGIFSARLYTARLGASGSVKMTEPDLSGPHQRRHVATVFAVALANVQGIKSASALEINAQRLAFLPGGRLPAVPHGIHVPLTGIKAGEVVRFAFGIDFLGMEDFALGPVAKRTAIKLTSNWPHPGFSGNFLPDTKRISGQGFEAAWSLNEFAVQTPGVMTEAGASASSGASGGRAAAGAAAAAQSVNQGGYGNVPALGIALVEPVNVYSQSYRAVQYGFLFVGLTFLLVLAYEFAGAAQVHPMQYGFIGLALAVFFLLLIALAEHIGFTRAYLAASLACVALVTWYATGVLAGGLKGLSVGASSGALFGVMYVLLQSEDHALLLGAILVFVVLAAVMLATRRLNWYGLGARLASASR